MTKKTTENQEIIATLKNVELFKGLDKPGDMEKIISILSMKKAHKGETIIKEGDIGDSLFIMKSGAVQILKRTLENEEYTIVTLQASEKFNPFFGELAMLDSDKRSATIIAEQECEFFLIRQKNFIELGNKYPGIGLSITRAISKILSQRLRKASSDIIVLFEALVGEVSEGTLE